MYTHHCFGKNLKQKVQVYNNHLSMYNYKTQSFV